AFYQCTSMTSVNIPKNVISIGSRAFYECNALTKIDFNAVEMDDISV
ncbi:MAG: leucine-rich repeat protein, partial [Clostridia bacterium]|nr:leucine-rich repeat protein [Clostridia bacterium]